MLPRPSPRALLLPLPGARATRDARDRAALLLGVRFDGARALRCGTVGDDVLHATRARPCDSVPTPLDLIAGAELPSGDVRAMVRSAH